ncbi:LysR family transcriptional regulator [Nitrogeniibacter mangrovi]|uniref:LysR family transcriptional regulator n=2 Tax=Nitrogeniibacter mangrovi TaxID=2016596 RepID=A0A6C1BB29_9RHOO|nr:LysR family transcriptional regulator [Nitrogeniibacter mangrovi]
MHTFVRIVEAGSLTAAAQQLETTQPTVSRRLKALERSLGVRLLQRSTHRMRLTEDGERCYRNARELLDRWDSFEAELRGAHEAPAGVLRVLAPHAFGQARLVEPLARYLNAYPGMRVEWLLHDDRAIDNFIGAGIDCAIRVGEVSDPELVSIRLAEVPRIVVAAPALLAGRPPLETAHDLRPLPWISLGTYYRTRATLHHAPSGRACTLNFTPRLVTDSLYALRSAALAGLGVCIGSAWVFAEDLAAGRLVRLVPDWRAEPLPVHLVYRYAPHYPARLRCFVDVFREALPAVIDA